MKHCKILCRSPNWSMGLGIGMSMGLGISMSIGLGISMSMKMGHEDEGRTPIIDYDINLHYSAVEENLLR